MSDAVTADDIRRAITADRDPPAKPFIVVPPFLEDAAREMYGDAVEIIVQARVPTATHGN